MPHLFLYGVLQCSNSARLRLSLFVSGWDALKRRRSQTVPQSSGAKTQWVQHSCSVKHDFYCVVHRSLNRLTATLKTKQNAVGICFQWGRAEKYSYPYLLTACNKSQNSKSATPWCITEPDTINSISGAKLFTSSWCTDIIPSSSYQQSKMIQTDDPFLDSSTLTHSHTHTDTHCSSWNCT